MKIYDNEKELRKDLRYWCSACGDLYNPHTDKNILTKELPEELQRLYEDYFTEGAGSYCYLVEYKGKYGIALINEYFEDEESGGFRQAVRAGTRFETLNIPSSIVLVGDRTGFPDGGERATELIAFFEADITKADFDKAAKFLLDNAYPKKEKYFGVTQFNHGHEYRWIYTDKVLIKNIYHSGILPEYPTVDCIDCGFPIGGSNSSATWIQPLEYEEVKDFLTAAGEGPDFEDPELVDLGEYMLTVEDKDVYYGSVTSKFIEEFGLNPRKLEQFDDDQHRKAGVEFMAGQLKKAGYKEFDYSNPFYGKNRNMRFSELCDLYVKVCGTKKSENPLEVETPAGILRAYKSAEPGMPGIHLMLQPTGYDEEIDVAGAVSYKDPEYATFEKEKPEDITIFVYGDATTEDYTNKEIIRRDDVITGLGKAEEGRYEN